MLSSRMRNAPTSPSSRAPSGVAVPAQCATGPYAAPRTRAARARVTSFIARPAERVRDQPRDPGGQHRPGQGDPVGRMHGRLVTAHPGGDKQCDRTRTSYQPGNPACHGEAGDGGHNAEQGGGGDQPQDRRTQNRTPRGFVRGPSRTQQIFVPRLNRRRHVFLRRPNRTHRASIPQHQPSWPKGRTRPQSREFTATGRVPAMLSQC